MNAVIVKTCVILRTQLFADCFCRLSLTHLFQRKMALILFNKFWNFAIRNLRFGSSYYDLG
jgi:hypothetical protein